MSDFPPIAYGREILPGTVRPAGVTCAITNIARLLPLIGGRRPSSGRHRAGAPSSGRTHAGRRACETRAP